MNERPTWEFMPESNQWLYWQYKGCRARVQLKARETGHFYIIEIYPGRSRENYKGNFEYTELQVAKDTIEEELKDWDYTQYSLEAQQRREKVH